MAFMHWKSIRLELGPTKDFPAGSVARAYLVRLPLNDEERIDLDALVRHPNKATVRRHWSTEPDERGVVTRSDGRWWIRCNGMPRALEMDSLPIRLGGQISLVESNGEVLPLRIASIR